MAKNPQFTLKVTLSQYSITSMVYFTMAVRVGKERISFGSSSPLVSLVIKNYVAYLTNTTEIILTKCVQEGKMHTVSHAKERVVTEVQNT